MNSEIPEKPPKPGVLELAKSFLASLAKSRPTQAASRGLLASEAAIHQGEELLTAGQVDVALDCFRRAVALAPEESDAWIGLARSLQEKGATKEALEAYRRGLDLSPGNAQGWFNMATVYINEYRLISAVPVTDVTGFDPFERALDCLKRAQNHGHRKAQPLAEVVALFQSMRRLSPPGDSTENAV